MSAAASAFLERKQKATTVSLHAPSKKRPGAGQQAFMNCTAAAAAPKKHKIEDINATVFSAVSLPIVQAAPPAGSVSTEWPTAAPRPMPARSDTGVIDLSQIDDDDDDDVAVGDDPEPPVHLSPDQQRVLDAAMHGDNVFFTGLLIFLP